MRTRTALPFALLLALPTLAHAQHAQRDSALATTITANADTVGRALTRYCGTAKPSGYVCVTRRNAAAVRSAADSLKLNAATAFRVDTLVRVDTVWKHDTTVVVQQGTPTPPADSTPAPAPVPAPQPVPAPVPVVFSHPYAPPTNGAVFAELPRDTVSVGLPPVLRSYVVTNLQAALDSAREGDELRVPPGTVARNVTLKPTARAGWITVRTDVTLGAPRLMSPARADSLNLATITTASASPALMIQPGAHHVYLRGLRFTTSYGPMNVIVRAHNDETAVTALPHDLTIAESVCDAGSNDVRRCVWGDIVRGALVNSTAIAHSNQGDSQALLITNSPGPFRVEGNDLQGSHQGTMLGGADPKIPGLIPCDIVVRGNHIWRPLAWDKVWQAKTLVEQKNGCRVLYEGNLVEHVNHDAQAGFAFLVKTENQECSAPWTQSKDITMRWNRVVNTANGFNFAANPGTCKGVDATRLTAYGNVVGCYNGTDAGRSLQLLGTLSDVIALHNTFACTGDVVVSLDNSTLAQRVVISGNILPHGSYGVKGPSTQEGTASITKFLPGALFESNVVYPAQCSLYPSSTLCSLPAPLPLSPDGDRVGADASKVPQP